jgi:hypothetical protein
MTPKPRVGAAVLVAAVAGTVGVASPDGWFRDLLTLPEHQDELRQAEREAVRLSAEAVANLDRIEHNRMLVEQVVNGSIPFGEAAEALRAANAGVTGYQIARAIRYPDSPSHLRVPRNLAERIRHRVADDPCLRAAVMARVRDEYRRAYGAELPPGEAE